jgi:nicotinamidase/pyrazinamidase
MKALILVDLQNDFLPGGTLAVPHGDVVIPLANQLQPAFRLIVATQDWHPPNHHSFAANYPGRKPGDVIKLRGRPQILWPVHCVQNTRGAQLTPGLMLQRVNKVFRKGTDLEIDSYSGFFDNDHQRATGLGEYLQDKKVTDVFVMGLATDYCVKFTALDAVALGFKTFLIEDACRGVNLKPDDTTHAIQELQQAGVFLVRSSQVMH